MRNLTVLVAALELIEERLKEPMKIAELAEACYSSHSGLQKLFNYAFHCSVNDYVTKRRISCASRELVRGDKSVTDVALDYQYGSPEAFSRAFKRLWGIAPSEFRKTRRFTELLPKFKLDDDTGGIIMYKRKPIDISELYDELKKLRGTYVLSFDLINFDRVNKDYGYAAGDIAIAEALARLERESVENMLLFRIGGDEFALVTGYTALPDAEALARRITARNGETVSSGGKDIPVSMRSGIIRLPEQGLNYREALEAMYGAIGKAREADDAVAVYFD